MNYEAHRKKMLKDKAARSKLPEYVLARSIIERRHKKKMTQLDVAKKNGYASIIGCTNRGSDARFTPAVNAQEDCTGLGCRAYHQTKGKRNRLTRFRLFI